MTAEAKRADLEKMILDAAEIAFAQHGFRGTSLDMIAALAGVSKQNMLYYYPSKAALYRRVLDNVLDGWLGSLDLFVGDEADPIGAFRQYVSKKLHFSKERPSGSRLYAMELMAGASDIADDIKGRVVPRAHRAALTLEKRWSGLGRGALEATHLIFLVWALTQTYAISPARWNSY